MRVKVFPTTDPLQYLAFTGIDQIYDAADIPTETITGRALCINGDNVVAVQIEEEELPESTVMAVEETGRASG